MKRLHDLVKTLAEFPTEKHTSKENSKFLAEFRESAIAIMEDITVADDSLIGAARDSYTDTEDNIEIDDFALSSDSDDGYWVSAWVFVRKEELE